MPAAEWSEGSCSALLFFFKVKLNINVGITFIFQLLSFQSDCCSTFGEQQVFVP